MYSLCGTTNQEQVICSFSGFNRKTQGHKNRIAKIISKQNKVGGLILLDFRTGYKTRLRQCGVGTNRIKLIYKIYIYLKISIIIMTNMTLQCGGQGCFFSIHIFYISWKAT